MSELIKEYLERLKSALSGSDPATVQDALSDAEEHLWIALELARGETPDIEEDEVIRSAIEEFGPAEEIASAYTEFEAMARPRIEPAVSEKGRSSSSRFFGVFTDPRAYASLFYSIFSLFLGLFYFTWTVSGLSISAGVIVLIVGLPFLGIFLMSLRGIALVDGWIIEALLGERMPRRPIYRKKPGNWRERLVFLIKDRMVWKTILYNILMLPLSIVYFTLSITSLSVAASLFLRPVLEYVFDLPLANGTDWSLWTPGLLMPVVVALGIIWFIMTLHMAKGLGRMHARIAKKMLVRD